jgi:hypothetical protein
MALCFGAFADASHLQHYEAGFSGRSATSAAAPRRRPTKAMASSASSRRSRVLQQVADVEHTLPRLEQVGGIL